MTREIRKHALAESDLIGIWEYTFREWDAAQADKYLDELDDGMKQLADNPEMGARRDCVREGYRVLFINSHAVLLHRRPVCHPYHPCASWPDGPREVFIAFDGR